MVKDFDSHLATAEIDISATLAQAGTFTAVAPRLLQDLCLAFDWDMGEAWALDVPSGLMRWRWIWHDPGIDAAEWIDLCHDNAIRSGFGIVGRVWATADPIWTQDIEAEQDFFRQSEASRIGLRSAYAFPLSFGGRVEGVVHVFSRRARKPEPVTMRSLETVGKEAGRLLSSEIAEAIGQQHLRTLIDHADDVLAVIALDGTIVYESDSVERVLGYPRRQRLGTRVFDYIHPDDLSVAFTSIRQGVQNPGTPQRLELRARSRTGEWVWLESIGSIHTQEPQRPVMVVVSRDITVRKLQEQALDTAAQRLRATVNSSPVILYQLDRDGVYLLNEGGALSAVGRQPGEAVGKPLSEVYADIPELQRLAALALQGESVSTEASIRGSWFQASLEPIFGTDGEVVSVAGMAVDITGLKEAQSILEHQGRLMESVALAEPLSVVLTEIAHFLEETMSSVSCVVWVTEPGSPAPVIAAPSIPGPGVEAVQAKVLELQDEAAHMSTFWTDNPDSLRKLGFSSAETIDVSNAAGTSVGAIELFSHTVRDQGALDETVLAIARRVIQVALLRTPRDNGTGEGRSRALAALPVAHPTVKRVKSSSAARAQLGITEGELSVLRLVAEGLSNKEIARSLSLSPHTVKDYLSSALAKLKVKNRAEAATVASKRRLI